MTDFYATNPLTMVYTKLWDILAARAEVDDLVVVGNRIRFDTNRDPVKYNISTADVPEILIAPESITGNLKSSSSSTKIDQIFGVVSATGDLRYTTFAAQVQWFIFGCLINWQNTLGTLLWQGKSFIDYVRLEDETVGFTSADAVLEERRKVGWTSLMRFTVGMHFTTSDVALELPNEL